MGPMGPNRPFGWVVSWALAHAKETYEGVLTAHSVPEAAPTDTAPAAHPVRHRRPHLTVDVQVCS